MKKLFLDDERFPVDDSWAIVRSVAEAQAWVLSNGFPDYVSFDNDLGDGLPEGRRFSEWLIDRDLDHHDMPDSFDFYVHSQNPVARDAIEGSLRSYMRYRKSP